VEQEEALKAFVEPETLNGSNQYFCEKCACKCDAHKVAINLCLLFFFVIVRTLSYLCSLFSLVAKK